MSGLGFQILKQPGHLLPDCCIYDPNLDALEAAVKSALAPIYVDETFTAKYVTVQDLYDDEHWHEVDLSSEDVVQQFLEQTWLRRAVHIIDKFVQVKGIANAFVDT